MFVLADYSITTPNTIHHLDALSYLSALPDHWADMMITSPPYDNIRDYHGYSLPFEAIAHQAYRVLKPGGVLVWVVRDATINGSETLTSFEQALYFKKAVGFKVHDTMIWDRGNVSFPDSNRYHHCFEYMFVFSVGSPATFNPQLRANKYGGTKITGGERQPNGTLKPKNGWGKEYAESGWLFNVWQISSGWMKTTKDEFAYNHPAMFPEELARRHILTWSNPGDMVVDCFMGSGTTAKMAIQNGRRYSGCDISAEYVALARKRAAQPYTLPMFETVAQEA